MCDTSNALYALVLNKRVLSNCLKLERTADSQKHRKKQSTRVSRTKRHAMLY